MKKALVLLFVICMALVLVACGKSIVEKAVEQMAEEMAEEMTEEIGVVNDVSIDSNEGTVTIGDGDDQVVFEGSEAGMPWPNDKLPANVPELKGVRVSSIASTDEGILIGFEECDEAQALAYKEQLISAGWIISIDMVDEDGGMIIASNESEESLMFVWNTDDQGGALTYSAAQ